MPWVPFKHVHIALHCIVLRCPRHVDQKGGSGYDTYLRLHTAVGLAAGGGELQTNDDNSDGICARSLDSAISITLPEGAYVIVVEGYSTMQGTFKLNLDCRAAGSVASDLQTAVATASSLQCGVNITGNTANGEPFLGNRARDILYRFTVTDDEDFQVTVSTCGSSYE